MFWKSKEKKMKKYNRTGKVPVIRISICTGESVAGFKDEKTGKFEDLMVIHEKRDLQKFMKEYGAEEGELRKEW